MRKSGVKGLGRLLSVLMVAALLMTTAMVPALALDRWEDVVVSVIWTDSQDSSRQRRRSPCLTARNMRIGRRWMRPPFSARFRCRLYRLTRRILST